MMGVSLRDKIRSDELRRKLGITPAIEFVKKQQLNWFGHITRQRKTNNTQAAINKCYETKRPRGRPRKRWIDGILESLGNVTAEDANRKAKDRTLTLPSTPTSE